MSDGGRDITGSDGEHTLVFQVKWTSKALQNPVTWLKGAVEAERKNIERLVREEGATEYRLMTSVAGTSTPKSGTMDRLDKELDKLSAEYGIRMRCLWQADIDSMVDNAPDATKWSYAQMLVGHDLIRYLIHGAQIEGRAAEMRETLLNVMSAQWGEDAKVKFSQVDMDHLNIVDLFVDVEETLDQPARNVIDAYVGNQQSRGEGAVQYLLRTTMPLTLIRGEPGQGKSTLGQYLCQVHRAAILPNNEITMGKSPDHLTADPKLALRADLKEYATWLLGQDPWGRGDASAKRPRAAERSIEHFLASLCAYHSGGRSVSVEQVQDLTQRYPLLVVLDGLDEVADAALRSEVVEQIDRFAHRMGGTAQRRFQIVVTTRPNNGGLREPSQDMFETVRLVRLSPALQHEYMRKWTAVHHIRGSKQRRLTKVFRDRSAQDHVAELAKNPMQLTILLFLVNRRGEGVPDARTAMYTQFMDTLLDREVEKDQLVKDNIPLVHELTAYLGWLMQSGVESRTLPDRLETKRIKRHLRNYLDEVDGPMDLVDQLFSAISDRFWALSSKVEGTFEFSVHSVREYFAARFLSEYAGLFGDTPVLRSEVLQALVDRSYWANTARFYAGFASPNELMTLVAGLEDSIECGRHPLQARVAVLTLLADGVFTPVAKAQRATAHLLSDPLSIRLLQPHPDPTSSPIDLPAERGGSDLAAALLTASAAAPGEPLSRDRMRVLPSLGMDRAEFEAWWRPRLAAAVGSRHEVDWLELGACFPTATLDDPSALGIALDCPAARRAAIALKARPPAKSTAHEILIRSVIDGEASDVPTAGTSVAGDLLKALRPQHFLRLATPAVDPLYLATVGHPVDSEVERKARSSIFKRLSSVDSRYENVYRASAVRRGEAGTTAPWQHTARELAAIHGPCLLAAEIALIGAIQVDIRTGGSVTPGSPAFGTSADYGMFVQETRANKSSATWWTNQLSECDDELSRVTWALALVAIADFEVAQVHIPTLDVVVSQIGDDTFFNIAQSSSRLAASAIGRRLHSDIWTAAQSASHRTQLLIAHHAASLETLDPLTGLTTDQLSQLARYGNASWPAIRAITTRIVMGEPLERLLDALEACGPDSAIKIPSDEPPDLPSLADSILSRPNNFPLGWVAVVERWHSLSHVELPLAKVATEKQWVPDL
ncbi:hypothetical protein A5740_11190 [Mycobacterium sp. GA-1841]|uniref:NACHT domain-containing protein n=1 Tax=Mycobacterium sp. GA-1841 TaxID=1834154 RepID=UPI00096CB5CE|nr:hypothetical protein [Mycobacterium sp. GA-1841]OMC33851.1 hypothetical protein A5740_11190 [Mycobacterium sp. GA-1841]